MKEITVSTNQMNQRLDKLLLKYLNLSTKSFIYKMLRKKNITLNDKKASGNEILKLNDNIKLFLSDETIEKFQEKSSDFSKKNISKYPNSNLLIEKNIIYQDDNVILINKPANMLSQKATKDDISINELLLSYVIDKKLITKKELSTFTPSICNRLDRNTTGLLIYGLSFNGLQEMARLLKDRSLNKYYLCLVKGEIKKGEILNIKDVLIKDEATNKVKIISKSYSQALLKNENRIETIYESIASNGKITLLKVKLVTGKTHQIRAHLSYINHPIIGDVKYGDILINKFYKEKYKVGHQLLHSYILEFPILEEPFLNISKKTFKALVPFEFEKIIHNELNIKI